MSRRHLTPQEARARALLAKGKAATAHQVSLDIENKLAAAGKNVAKRHEQENALAAALQPPAQSFELFATDALDGVNESDSDLLMFAFERDIGAAAEKFPFTHTRQAVLTP